jgi:hypothetical protein
VLQVVPTDQQLVAIDFKQIITDLNTARALKNISALTQNTTLTQIINQWGANMRNSMSIVQYLQIYGIMDLQTYTFTTIPADYLVDVVENQCK